MTAWKAWAMGALLTLGTAALAETVAESVVRQLREQGYVEFSVERTWLGRVQVIAVGPDGARREIVFSPATGEILRDYATTADGAPAAPRIMDRESDEVAPRRPDDHEGPSPGDAETASGGAGAPGHDGDDGSHGTGGPKGAEVSGEGPGHGGNGEDRGNGGHAPEHGQGQGGGHSDRGERDGDDGGDD